MKNKKIIYAGLKLPSGTLMQWQDHQCKRKAKMLLISTHLWGNAGSNTGSELFRDRVAKETVNCLYLSEKEENKFHINNEPGAILFSPKSNPAPEKIQISGLKTTLFYMIEIQNVLHIEEYDREMPKAILIMGVLLSIASYTKKNMFLFLNSTITGDLECTTYPPFNFLRNRGGVSNSNVNVVTVSL